MLTLPELALQHITKKGIIMDNENLKRIADALEEILRLVKQDMKRMKE